VPVLQAARRIVNVTSKYVEGADVRSISEYMNEIEREQNALAEERVKASNDRWMTRKAKVQAIIDQNIALFRPSAVGERARLRDWASSYAFQDKFADMACDKCGTELIVGYEDVGFGEGTDEVYNCLGCGARTHVRKMRR
jgi:hypothetical protein